MRLALFDLDHTLIPFDSGMAWTDFLVDGGVLPPEHRERHLQHCQQYVAGTLGIEALYRMSMAPLARRPRAELASWQSGFEARMASCVPHASRELVQCHRDAGDVCVLVTATARFIAQPFARLFGLAHVLATEPVWRDDRLTGEIDGPPCHRTQKLRRVHEWLSTAGLHLGAFERSWFYSDAIADLPLLQAVTDPVAVRPDAPLREHARRSGWKLIDVAP